MENSSLFIPAFSLMGPPGSGKGTHAHHFAKEYGFDHIALGSMIRRVSLGNAHHDLRDRIHELYTSGIPQDDEVVLELLRQHLSDLHDPRGIIFDAFPLSITEAEALLEEIVPTFHLRRPFVIVLDIPVEVAQSRIGTRRVCVECGKPFSLGDAAYERGVCDRCGGELIRRSDDAPDVVARRYEEYAKRIPEVTGYLAQRGVTVMHLDAARAPGVVQEDITRILIQHNILPRENI